MTEQEAYARNPDWYNIVCGNKDWDSDTIRVSQNVTHNGEWHSYKRYLRDLWILLNEKDAE